ncbi:MAG: phosphatidate cytidylyltransferase [Gammaproteobacteria bacterium]|nr:phosphatidate cytidylyltransferase [Gammaproteobacteria bacterium]
MLWQRVLTALVLIPVVVGGILLLDTGILALVLGAVLLLGAWEMGRLGGLAQGWLLAVYAGVVGVLMWLAWRFLVGDLLIAVQWLMTGWWVVTSVVLVARRQPLDRVDGQRPVILLLGALVLVTAWISTLRLHAVEENGPALLLFLFILIWVADSGAYFAGRAFGRRKLSPQVSPGKTWAGVAGAMAGALLCAAGLMLGGWSGNAAVVPLALLCLLVTALSIGGDLWESRLKREAGVKDSGAILPGHGGALDRIDSLLAAAPVFVLGAALIGVTP